VDEAGCPFCSPESQDVFFTGVHVLAMWDRQPITAGHALIATRRHVQDWFAASVEEQADLLRALAVVKSAVEMKHAPQGYNITINVGEVAGQNVLHLHVHVIPRYANVPIPPWDGSLIARRGAGRTQHSEEVSHGQQLLVRGGESDPLFRHLVTLLDSADQVDIAAAFTMESGVRLLEEYLRDVLDRGGRVRLLTGDYLGVTEPNALRRLLDLQGDMQLRIFESAGTSFHPKAYIVTTRDGEASAFVGSSNFSDTALRRGIEWNYRILTSREDTGFAEVVAAFEELWIHAKVRPVTPQWIDAYTKRRLPPISSVAGVSIDPVGPPPEPHTVQLQALVALQNTRAEGNTAGLVVLATGLGKTWLSAFDTVQGGFNRVLFVAHREEILSQAMRTFRTIRPTASLGLYTGTNKFPDADIVFASIQTLSRKQHLHRFDPKAFEYVIIDEFHHAAAATYRRVTSYFEPQFMLGLTATPERTDGGDLLSLCGNNLVYRCDLAEGIRRGLLAPFAYFGVPDEVDYSNIPWRNNRFDENELTAAVATQARAENALQQYRRLARQRTIGFCVSQRHADFMADYFRTAGISAVAVHSGPTSAPRAHSLEQLSAGELDVVFAVDMFNEGVDLPNVDTILMLRPTESRIMWLQQFGRGLRYLPGKTLQVIDYIGNHRVFLTKTRALFNLGNADRDVAYALDQLDAGTPVLPEGCSVTYELEAKEILRSLLKTDRDGTLQAYYTQFKELHGVRPLALEIFEDGLDPKAARSAGYASWLDFVSAMGDFSPEQVAISRQLGPFLASLEVTPITKSYKLLVLLGMLADDAFPGGIRIDRLVERFADHARRYAPLRTEIGEALDNPRELRKLIETDPIAAWTGGAGTGGIQYFRYTDESFATAFPIDEDLREPLQDLVHELIEWRLAVYLQRTSRHRGIDHFLGRVAQSNGRPIIFLDRERVPGIPEGWQDVQAGEEHYQANFVKIAVNVLAPAGSQENKLPDLLRQWFGPDAGASGRTDHVEFQRRGSMYVIGPYNPGSEVHGPVLWNRYKRSEAVAALRITFKGREEQAGIVRRPGGLVFFVTLDKGEMAKEHQYEDRFLSPTEFEWQSQNRTTQASEMGQEIRNHLAKGIDVHLFVRRTKRIRGGAGAPFIYAGTLEFLRWEREKPITVWWKLRNEVPVHLRKELQVPDSQ